MADKKPLSSHFVRWSLRLIGLAFAVFALQIGLLAYPQVLLSKEADAGSVVVHYRGDQDPAIQKMASQTDHRLQLGGFGNPEYPSHIFFFPDQRLYSLFTRLARLQPEAQGFGVSFLGTSYVSGPRVRALGERTSHSPTYSVWEGSIPHTMAHEVAHIILIDSIGRSAWLDLPHWKQEGLPEYIANIGLLRADSTTSLPERIEILLDDERWLGPRSWDRIHYEAGLLVEFLMEVESLDLRAVLDDRVTREATYSEMVVWSRAATSR